MRDRVVFIPKTGTVVVDSDVVAVCGKVVLLNALSNALEAMLLTFGSVVFKVVVAFSIGIALLPSADILVLCIDIPTELVGIMLLLRLTRFATAVVFIGIVTLDSCFPVVALIVGLVVIPEVTANIDVAVPTVGT